MKDSFLYAVFLLFVKSFQVFATFFPTLLDINECAPGGGHTCHEKATCQNTPGSFSCTCKPGYSGNGAFCKGNVFLVFVQNLSGIARIP